MQNFKVNDMVRFGRENGEQTLGKVIKVNPTTLKVQQTESRGTLKSHAIGTVWKVPPSLCTLVSPNGVAQTPQAPTPVAKAPSRSEAAILADARDIENRLSPENLYCDGERSRSEATRIGAGLRKRLRELEAELGRKITGADLYPGLPVLPPVSIPWFSKPANFNKGDKVSFTVPRQGVVVGEVERVNGKTVTVLANTGSRWRVSPSALKAA